MLLASMMMAAMADPTQNSNSGVRAKDVTGKLPNKPRPSNHKPFNIEGVTIWALNEKNARKKYNKQHGNK